nr:MAG: polyprotein [Wufeng shrew iflavirus 16]
MSFSRIEPDSRPDNQSDPTSPPTSIPVGVPTNDISILPGPKRQTLPQPQARPGFDQFVEILSRYDLTYGDFLTNFSFTTPYPALFNDWLTCVAHQDYNVVTKEVRLSGKIYFATQRHISLQQPTGLLKFHETSYGTSKKSSNIRNCYMFLFQIYAPDDFNFGNAINNRRLVVNDNFEELEKEMERLQVDHPKEPVQDSRGQKILPKISTTDESFLDWTTWNNDLACNCSCTVQQYTNEYELINQEHIPATNHPKNDYYDIFKSKYPDLPVTRKMFRYRHDAMYAVCIRHGAICVNVLYSSLLVAENICARRFMVLMSDLACEAALGIDSNVFISGPLHLNIADARIDLDFDTRFSSREATMLGVLGGYDSLAHSLQSRYMMKNLTKIRKEWKKTLHKPPDRSPSPSSTEEEIPLIAHTQAGEEEPIVSDVAQTTVLAGPVPDMLGETANIVSPQRMAATTPYTDFKSIANIWYPVMSFSLTPTLIENSIVTMLRLPYDLTKILGIAEPFTHSVYGTYDLELKIVGAGHEYMTGKMIVAVLNDPIGKEYSSSATTQLLQVPHEIFDCKLSNDIKIRVPYFGRQPYMVNRYANKTTPCYSSNLYCVMLVPMRLGNETHDKVDVRIYARISASHLAFPIPLTATVQGPTPPNAVPVSEDLSFVTSQLSQDTFSITQGFQINPIPYFQRPQKPEASFGHNDGGVMPFIPGPGSFNDLIHTWGLRSKTTWSLQDLPDSRLASIACDPHWRCMSTADTDPVFTGVPSPLEYGLSFFHYWAGSIDFKIVLNTTKYHKGTLMVAIVPDPTYNILQAQNCINKVYNLVDGKEIVEISCPFNWDAVAKVSGSPLPDETFDTLPADYAVNTYAWNVVTPYPYFLNIYCVNDLNGPDCVSSMLQLQIYWRAGSDMSVACPRPSAASIYRPSGVLTTTTDLGANQFPKTATATGTFSTALGAAAGNNTTVGAYPYNKYARFQSEDTDDPTYKFDYLLSKTKLLNNSYLVQSFIDFLKQPLFIYRFDPGAGHVMFPIAPPNPYDMCSNATHQPAMDHTIHMGILAMFRWWRGSIKLTFVAELVPVSAIASFSFVRIPPSGARLLNQRNGARVEITKGPFVNANIHPSMFGYETEWWVPQLEPTKTFECKYETPQDWMLMNFDEPDTVRKWGRTRDYAENNLGYIRFSGGILPGSTVNAYWSAGDDFELSNFVGTPRVQGRSLKYVQTRDLIAYTQAGDEEPVDDVPDPVAEILRKLYPNATSDALVRMREILLNHNIFTLEDLRTISPTTLDTLPFCDQDLVTFRSAVDQKAFSTGNVANLFVIPPQTKEYVSFFNRIFKGEADVIREIFHSHGFTTLRDIEHINCSVVARWGLFQSDYFEICEAMYEHGPGIPFWTSTYQRDLVGMTEGEKTQFFKRVKENSPYKFTHRIQEQGQQIVLKPVHAQTPFNLLGGRENGSMLVISEPGIPLVSRGMCSGDFLIAVQDVHVESMSLVDAINVITFFKHTLPEVSYTIFRPEKAFSGQYNFRDTDGCVLEHTINMGVTVGQVTELLAKDLGINELNCYLCLGKHLLDKQTLMMDYPTNPRTIFHIIRHYPVRDCPSFCTMELEGARKFFSKFLRLLKGLTDYPDTLWAYYELLLDGFYMVNTLQLLESTFCTIISHLLTYPVIDPYFQAPETTDTVQAHLLAIFPDRPLVWTQAVDRILEGCGIGSVPQFQKMDCGRIDTFSFLTLDERSLLLEYLKNWPSQQLTIPTSPVAPASGVFSRIEDAFSKSSLIQAMSIPSVNAIKNAAIACVPTIGIPAAIGLSLAEFKTSCAKINSVADVAQTSFESVVKIIEKAVAEVTEKMSLAKDMIRVIFDVILDVVSSIVHKTWQAFSIAIIRFISNVLSVPFSLISKFTGEFTSFLEKIMAPPVVRVQSDLTDWALARNEDEVDRSNTMVLNGILLGLIGTATGIYFQGPPNLSAHLIGVLHRLTTSTGMAYINQCIVFIKSTFDVISNLIQRAVLKMSPEVAALKTLTDSSVVVANFIKNAHDVMSESNATMLSSPQFRTTVWKTVMQSKQLQSICATLPSRAVPPHLLRICSDVVKFGNEKFMDVAASPVRYEPLVICIEGAPGIGKSFMTEKVVSVMLERIGFKKCTSGLCYYRQPCSKFWSGYRDQPVIVYDDWMNMKRIEEVGEEIREMYEFKSTSLFVPPMADLSEKKIRANPLIVVLLCNNAFPLNTLANGVQSPESVLRRRDIVLHARLKDVHKGKNPRDLPLSETRDSNHLEFARYSDSTSPHSLSENHMPTSETTNFLADFFNRYHEQEKLNVRERITQLNRALGLKEASELDLADPFRIFYDYDLAIPTSSLPSDYLAFEVDLIRRRIEQHQVDQNKLKPLPSCEDIYTGKDYLNPPPFSVEDFLKRSRAKIKRSNSSSGAYTQGAGPEICHSDCVFQGHTACRTLLCDDCGNENVSLYCLQCKIASCDFCQAADRKCRHCDTYEKHKLARQLIVSCKMLKKFLLECVRPSKFDDLNHMPALMELFNNWNPNYIVRMAQRYGEAAFNTTCYGGAIPLGNPDIFKYFYQPKPNRLYPDVNPTVQMQLKDTVVETVELDEIKEEYINMVVWRLAPHSNGCRFRACNSPPITKKLCDGENGERVFVKINSVDNPSTIQFMNEFAKSKGKVSITMEIHPSVPGSIELQTLEDHLENSRRLFTLFVDPYSENPFKMTSTSLERQSAANTQPEEFFSPLCVYSSAALHEITQKIVPSALCLHHTLIQVNPYTIRFREGMWLFTKDTHDFKVSQHPCSTTCPFASKETYSGFVYEYAESARTYLSSCLRQYFNTKNKYYLDQVHPFLQPKWCESLEQQSTWLSLIGDWKEWIMTNYKTVLKFFGAISLAWLLINGAVSALTGMLAFTGVCVQGGDFMQSNAEFVKFVRGKRGNAFKKSRPYFQADEKEQESEPIPKEVPNIDKINSLHEVVRGKIVHNAFHIHFVKPDGTMFKRNILGIGLIGHFALINRHYLKHLKGYHKEGCTVKIVPLGDPYNARTYAFDQSDFICSPEADLALWRMPKSYPMFKDIRRYIATLDDMEKAMPNSMVLFAPPNSSTVAREIKVTVAGLIERKSVTDSDGTIIEACNVFQYDFGEPGLCGALLLNPRSTRPIIGMHFAGADAKVMSVGYAIALVQELLIFPELDATVQEQEDWQGPDLADARMIMPESAQVQYIGTLPPDKVPYAPTKTKIKKSHVHNIGGLVAKTEPCILTSKDPRYTHPIPPAIAGCAKHGKLTTDFPSSAVKDAAEAAWDLWFSTMPPVVQKPRRLTVEEACIGIPSGGQFYGPIKLSTSAGWPWNTEVKTQKKDYIEFERDEQEQPIAVKSISAEVLDEIKRKEQLRKKGVVPISIFTDTLKDERRKPDKLKSLGGTRIFCSSSLDVTIATRQNFLHFSAAFMENRHKTPHAVGIDASGPEWTILTNNLLAKNPNKIVTLDYSNFGPGFNACVAAEAYDLMCRWTKKNVAGVDINELQALSAEMYQSVHALGNTLYRQTSGSPSGGAVTTIINSLVNIIYVLLAWRALCGPDAALYENFKKHVCLYVYGDDLVMAVEEVYIEKFNAQTINTYFEKHGITTTNATKTDAIKAFDNLGNSQFLKRGFRKHDVHSFFWTSPLDWTSIEDCTQWIYEAPDLGEATRENCRVALEHSHQWGRAKFAAFKEQVNKALVSVQLQPLSLTWESIDRLHFKAVYDDNLGDEESPDIFLGVT